MPYVIGRPSKYLAVAGTVAGLLFAAPSAMAHQQSWQSQSQSCPSLVSTQLLSSLSDSAFYAPLPGGTFEDGGAGWTYNNASVVSGNEPDNVVNSTDSQSLNIGPGGSAVSPVFCVDQTFPSFRFFALSNGSGPLYVSGRWTTPWGQSGQTPITTLYPGDYSTWQPTPSEMLGSQVPAGLSVQVQLVFSSSPNGGNWNIDDVLVDPYAK